MSIEFRDAEQLANLLRRQRELSLASVPSGSTDQAAAAKREVTEIRRDCIQLVERYFRAHLQPILAKRFPNKGLHPAHQTYSSAREGQFRYTELINDFFLQVLSRFDDPFWRSDSAIALRNYASIVISNHGVRDALRRRKKQKPLPEADLRETFEDQLAAEVESRFGRLGLEYDAGDLLDVVQQWEKAGGHFQQLATLIRHLVVSGMTPAQVQADLNISRATFHRWYGKATDMLRQTLS